MPNSADDASSSALDGSEDGIDLATVPAEAVADEVELAKKSIIPNVSGEAADEEQEVVAEASQPSDNLPQKRVSTSRSMADSPAAASQTNTHLKPHFDRDTIYIKDAAIPFKDTYLVDRAPEKGAGVWRGDDSTTDGNYCYFIGHHPGAFNCVMDLHDGDNVTVCDDNGNARTYKVYKIYDVPSTTSWEEVAPDVENHGEMIALQTCVGNGNYRIVLAA